MATDTSDIIVVRNDKAWRRWPRGTDVWWSLEKIMARIALIAVCLLLVGVWVHPYVSGAFVRQQAIKSGGLSSDTTEPATRPAGVNASPLKAFKGTEGFWRIAKAEDGVWWFVSPTGERQFLNTVTTVQPFQAGRDKNGVHFVSRDWNGSVDAYDGDLKAWATKTLARLNASGFKGIGAWSHPIFHELDVPITRDLNVWKHYHPGNYLLYSADWESYGDNLMTTLVAPLAGNKNLVGYFIDNELDWSDASVGPCMYFDGMMPEDPNRRAVIATIKTLWPTLEAYNAAWNTKFTDYAELDTLPKLDREPAEPYAKLFDAWLEKLATRYFEVTTRLIRKHDPNHLILGVRFAGFAPPAVVRASAPYTDAQSINYYPADGKLDPDMFARTYADSNQPIMITEYGFHALDGRSGNRNTFGFQAQVPDQQARAQGYAEFTSRLAKVPYIIGADWFQWSDEPASGRNADGEDVNFGMVDVDDQPYEKLIAAVQQTGPKLNGLHAASQVDDAGDVWRESFATKPVARVLKLDRPPRVNGNLSDWSEMHRLPGVRTTQTVGYDRNPAPQPNVYLGWRDEGLYLAFEVFDEGIQSTPGDGRWWTRDHVEFWVSTRPTSKDQQVYDANCHQFFFVPNERPSEGVLGVVGQWHRPGDAIKENMIPHPDVIQQARILPDRYVTEMFVPARVMHGWDPQASPEIAFNLHVRNFEVAADYFWSAPKELYTQVRPNTWGTLVLTNQQFTKK